MRFFLALVIYMGAKRDSDSKSFWKELEENREILRSKSLKRFSQIERYCYNRGFVLVILAAGNLSKLTTKASLLYRDTNTFISIV